MAIEIAVFGATSEADQMDLVDVVAGGRAKAPEIESDPATEQIGEVIRLIGDRLHRTDDLVIGHRLVIGPRACGDYGGECRQQNHAGEKAHYSLDAHSQCHRMTRCPQY